MGLDHGNIFSVGLAHSVQEHRRLARALLADQEVVLTFDVSADDAVDLLLLFSHDPMFRVQTLFFIGANTSNLKGRVSRFEGMIYFL